MLVANTPFDKFLKLTQKSFFALLVAKAHDNELLAMPIPGLFCSAQPLRLAFHSLGLFHPFWIKTEEYHLNKNIVRLLKQQ